MSQLSQKSHQSQESQSSALQESPRPGAHHAGARKVVTSLEARDRACVGQPEDMAHVVAFLASDKARHITGEVIKVDGGQYI